MPLSADNDHIIFKWVFNTPTHRPTTNYQVLTKAHSQKLKSLSENTYGTSIGVIRDFLFYALYTIDYII